MDEGYLRSWFSRSPELVSVVLKWNRETRGCAGCGYLNFADHATADQILRSYNGQKMPNTDRNFFLSWVQNAAPGDDHALYVGGLGLDVTDFMLQKVFKNRYPSVKRATVAWDTSAKRSKGYGFVVFGDVNEHRQAMTEMNGVHCSGRPMRIGPATVKSVMHSLNHFKLHDTHIVSTARVLTQLHEAYCDFCTQGTYSDCNPYNTRLFVGNLESVTFEDLYKAFSPYGELTVKVIEWKRCGFVTYSSRPSAEEALRILNGSQLGDNTITVNWARPPPNKQDQWSVVDHGYGCCPGYGYGCCPVDPQSSGVGYGYGCCPVDPQSSGVGYGCCPVDPNALGYTGHSGYAYQQQQQPRQTSVQ